MADNKTVKITFEIDGLEQSVSSIDDAKAALKGLEQQAKDAEKSVEDTGKEIKNMGSSAQQAGEAGEGAMVVLDEATGGLANKARNVVGGFKAMGKSAVTAFKGAIAGANGMKKALIASGIGAIVVAVGLLVAYWDDIVGLVSGVSSESKTLLKTTEATRDAASEQLEATQASESSLRLAGKSEDEIRQLKIEQTKEIIFATEQILAQQKLQKASQVAAAERNQKISAGILAFLMLPITVLLGAVDALTAGLAYVGVLEKGTNLVEEAAMGAASLIFDPAETAEEGDATIKETEKQLNALKNKRDGFILKGQANDKKASDDKAQNARDLEDELERLRAENIAGEEAKALALLEIEKRKQEEELIAKGASKELLLELDTNYETRKAEIEEGFRLAREEKQIADDALAAERRQLIDDALQQANLDSMDQMFERAQAELEIQRQADVEKLLLAGATADEIAKINGKYAAKNKALVKDEADYTKMLKDQEVQNSLNAGKDMLDSIVNLVGEGTAVGKAAAIASTTISTYQSATAAYASVVGIPVVGPVLAPIAAGVAVASGLMSIKNILSTKTPGNKPVPGGGGAPSVPAAPTYDPSAALAAAGGEDEVNNVVTSSQQQGSTQNVIKAYVVSDDMTTQQEADAKINDLARL